MEHPYPDLSKKIPSCAVLALCVSFCASHTATAGDFLDLSIEELIQVDVTVASLFASNELATPATVAVINESDWSRMGARRTLDALAGQPATMVLPVNAGLDVVAVRGYAQTTSARGLATLLDGVPLNNFSFGTGQYNAPNINLGVLDRIEMIQGPGSALYGSDAFHGVLALHAFESDHDVSRVTTELGDNGYYQGATKYSAAVGESRRINAAVAASGQPDQDRLYSYTDATTQQAASTQKGHRYRSQTASMKYIAKPSQAFHYRWSLFADRYHADGFPLRNAVSDTEQDSSMLLSSLVLTRKLQEGLTLDIASYYRQDAMVRSFWVPVGASALSIESDGDEYRTGLSFTLKRRADEHNPTQWALAMGYERADITNGVSEVTFPNGTVSRAHRGDEGAYREVRNALFEADTRLADGRWHMVYGGRFDHYSDFGNHVSPRFGMVFNPEPRSAIKLLYGHAFRAPTSAELYAREVGIQGNEALSPETLDYYELIVMKYGLAWRASATVFVNHWDDAIVQVRNLPSPDSYVNSGENRAEGLCAKWSWLPADARVDVGGSYVSSENRSTEQDYEQFPRIMLYLGLGYTIAKFDTDIYLGQHVWLEAEAAPETPTAASEELPPFWRADLHLKKKISPTWAAFLNTRNLFDRNNAYPSVLGVEHGVPDEPFTLSLGVRGDF